MKTNTLLTTVSAFCLLHSAFGQGALTPPGTPAPTMKSLAQIEPRTDVLKLAGDGFNLFIIAQPGSYYLTTNLVVAGARNGITITTNNVTLDLSGFTIFSTGNGGGAAGTGIYLKGEVAHIAIRNGNITGGVTNNGAGSYFGAGFFSGIDYDLGTPDDVRVANVSVSGCGGNGINLGNNSILVESCTVNTVGSSGIVASTVKSSVALDCGNDAIHGIQVSDCRGQSTSGIGVSASTAQNCYGSSGSGTGISANTAQNCEGSSNGGGGTYGLYAITALNSYGSSGSGSGLIANTAQNCEGVSGGGSYGVYALDIATGCSGYSSGGTGLSAFIANGCRGQTGSGTALSATHNVNSF